MSDALARLSAATSALAEAKTLDEIKQVRDIAVAAQTYARAARLGLEAQNHAAEVKLRAERKAGEMLAQLERTPPQEARIMSIDGRDSDYGNALAVTGTTRQEANRWQTIAALPADVFEETISETVAAREELTTAGVLRVAKGMEGGTLPHVAHNSGNNEWYTPPEFLASVREVLGVIDLDPASSAIANKTVGALRYFTAEDDGLAQTWRGRVFMNPPYAGDLVGRFTDKLCQHVRNGDVTEAIVLVNNATETAWFQQMAQLATVICFPRGRVRFLSSGGEVGAPLQGQAFLYFGPFASVFARAFDKHGIVVGRDAI